MDTTKLITHVLVKWLARRDEYGPLPASERLYTFNEWLEDPDLDDDSFSVYEFLTSEQALEYIGNA